MRLDRTRSEPAKIRTLNRRAQRRLKTAALFLAFAFADAADDFAPSAH
jgi:hypothetical protein